MYEEVKEQHNDEAQGVGRNVIAAVAFEIIYSRIYSRIL